jgi:hypothetical protein
MTNFPTTGTDYDLRPGTSTPAQKALSQAVAEADWNGGNLFPRLTNLLMVVPPGGTEVSDHFVTLGGPSALPTPYWVPTNHVAPTVPTDITWTDGTSGNSITPKTMLISSTVDQESMLRVRLFESIVDGTAAPGPNSPGFDPVLASWFGQAMTREMGRVFAASSNNTTDPVHSIGGYAGIGRRTLGRAISWTDLTDAYGDMIGDSRFYPSVAWVSPVSYAVLRNEKDGVGGYLHETSEPLLLDVRVNADGSTTSVPIVPLRGIPEGGGSFALLAESKRIVAVHREVAPGLLVRVDRSEHTKFNIDQYGFRMMRRLDFGIAPGNEAAIMRIDCVTNPA